MKDHFEGLYRYNQWANDLFCEKLHKINCKNSEILRLFSHVFNAQEIWLNRINESSNAVGVWDEFDLDTCIERLKRSNADWIEWLKRPHDFDKNISFTNSAGESHIMRLGDIVIHVANHSTHHRGQIATLLRQQNIAPPKGDYYYFALSEK